MKKLLLILSFILLAFAGFSQTFCLVENDEITLTGLPSTYTSKDGTYWYKNYRSAPYDVWYNDGFRVVVTPQYDAETERLGTQYVDTINDVVTWEVISLSEAEIAAKQEAILQAIDNQLDVKDIKYLFRILVKPVIDTLTLDSTSISAFKGVYKQWRAGRTYDVASDDPNERFFVYQDTLYRVIGEKHTSQSDWLPDISLSLYRAVIPPGVVQPWTSDIYLIIQVGDKVSHNGVTYTCINSTFAWIEPGTASSETAWEAD